jgi:hypothetical protein
MNDLAKPVKVKATIMWCFHNKPNEMSTKYQVDLCNLSTNAVTFLEGLGVEVRKREDKPEKGFFITCKSTSPIKVFDANGVDLSTVAIGNGSTATAVVGTYSWAWKNKKGVSPSLIKLVIDSLVAYEEGQAIEESLDEVL